MNSMLNAYPKSDSTLLPQLRHWLRPIVFLALGALGFQGLHADVAPPAGSSRVYVQIRGNQKANVVSNIVGAGGKIHYEFDSLGAVAATLPDKAIAALSNNPSVRKVEADPVRYLYAETIPAGIPAVQADTAWSTADGSGVVVGVIDSGIYPGHVDFDGLSMDGYPESITTTIRGGGKPRTETVVLTDDDEAYWGRDYSGHGTHVSGTIAAVANNNVGVVGVSKASIFMVKVFGDTGNWIYSSSLVNAIQQAVNVGNASVINMSLGGGAPSSTEEAGMDSFVSQGVVLVAAAGNDGTTGYSYPASYNSVISVGAVSVDGGGSYTVADFSQKNDQVEIAAPGVSVLSTVPFNDNTSITVGGSTILGNGVENSASSSGVTAVLVDGLLAEAQDTSWAGKVVLVSRGNISFADKVQNVQNSGGVAAVIYNNEAGPLSATLGTSTSTIPAIGITQADGQALLGSAGQSATVVSQLEIPGSGYEAWDGTSMASPHVAGGVAILLGAYDNATVQNVRDAMNESAKDLGAAERDNAYGHGLLQINDALVALGAIMAGGGGGGGGGGGDPVVISDLNSRATNSKNGRFEITWTTNVPTDGQVDIGGSVSSSAELTTSHKFGFRGSKGATYSYTVTSTGADGESATASGTHNN